MSTKAEIFNKYKDSKPINIQSIPRSIDQVNADFMLFVKGYKEENLLDVDVSDKNGTSDELNFYRLAMTKLFHVVFGNFKQTMFGSANSQMFKIRRDGGTYRLQTYGLLAGRGTVEVSDAIVTLSANSLKLFSNNGNILILEKTGELYNTNEFSTGADKNMAQIFQLTILKKNILVGRFHLVELTM